MEVKQIYEFVNSATKEAIGESAIVNEDLSNVVSVGTEIFNAEAVDKYVKALVNRIGKTIFVNRVYNGSAPGVLMDAWEFGSVLQKIQSEFPEATINESWELEDGHSYDPNVFHKPLVSAKFYNKKVTFEIDMSFTEMQVKQSFNSATELNSFLSMLFNDVEKSMTVKLDELILRNINNIIGETIYDDYGVAPYSSKSGVKAVNLLKLYNDEVNSSGTPLTVAKALYNMEFLKFASARIKEYVSLMKKMSVLFNIGKKKRFTTGEFLKLIMLEKFKSCADTYLQSSVFHDDMTKLPGAESVAYWQGSGEDLSFSSLSKIDVTTTQGHIIQTSGVLACIYDKYAVGVCNYNRRVTTNHNSNAEFFTNFYKADVSYFNDFNENFVVFFIA